MQFKVIDKKTGVEPDIEKIITEDWANGLAQTDIDCFAMTQYGELLLLDECGRFRFCPLSRFEITLEIKE